jgi:hypothetical protein
LLGVFIGFGIGQSLVKFILIIELSMAYKKPMPTIRPSAERSVQYAIEKVFRTGQIDFPYRNCLNCSYWSFADDLCGKFKAKPPTEVLVYSCEAYEEIEIPF